MVLVLTRSGSPKSSNIHDNHNGDKNKYPAALLEPQHARARRRRGRAFVVRRQLFARGGEQPHLGMLGVCQGCGGGLGRDWVEIRSIAMEMEIETMAIAACCSCDPENVVLFAPTLGVWVSDVATTTVRRQSHHRPLSDLCILSSSSSSRSG